MRSAWWLMGAENGRMWAYRPVGADALVGPRLPPDQRQGSVSEKRTQEYLGFPRAKGFPKGIAFDPSYYKRVPTIPSPAAWRYALRADRPAETFFSFGPGAARLSPA